MSVLQLCRELLDQPFLPVVPGVTVRNYCSHADQEIWLAIRQEAFQVGPISVRNWSSADFQAEFLDAWWWSPDRMWIAETAGEAIGAVTLGERGSAGRSRPVVHWLGVRPAWRQRGVGRLLMTHLEAACWEAGRRRVWLETHAAWREAMAFYRRLGYGEARNPPRDGSD